MTDKSAVRRSVSVSVTNATCVECNKTVYEMEKIVGEWDFYFLFSNWQVWRNGERGRWCHVEAEETKGSCQTERGFID